MSKLSFLPVLFTLLLAIPSVVRADSKVIPRAIRECEGQQLENCAELTLSGKTYTGTWTTGNISSPVIEQWGKDGVVLTRSDTVGIFSGVKIRYVGIIKTDGSATGTGKVEWAEHFEGTIEGPWSASPIVEPKSDAANGSDANTIAKGSSSPSHDMTIKVVPFETDEGGTLDGTIELFEVNKVASVELHVNIAKFPTDAPGITPTIYNALLARGLGRGVMLFRAASCRKMVEAQALDPGRTVGMQYVAANVLDSGANAVAFGFESDCALSHVGQESSFCSRPRLADLTTGEYVIVLSSIVNNGFSSCSKLPRIATKP